MDRSKQSLAAAVRRVVEAARRSDGGHPAVGDLLAYQAGELGPGRRQEVQNHLALCHECTRTVLDLAAFSDLEPHDGDSAPAAREEVASAWRALVAALESEALGPAPAEGSGPGPRPAAEPARLAGGRGAARGTPALRAVLAASVVLALALGAWTWTLRRQIERLRSPQGNVVVTDLLPLEDARRRAGAEGPATVEVRDGRTPYVLILNLPQPSPFSTHRLEVERVAPPPPAVVWTEDGLVPGPHGSFHLAIPGDFLRAGSYRFKLFGLSGEERRLLASYEARIEAR